MFSSSLQFKFDPLSHNDMLFNFHKDGEPRQFKRRKTSMNHQHCNSSSKENAKRKHKTKKIEIMKELHSKNDEHYVINLKKRIANKSVTEYVNQQIQLYKETHYRPTYYIETDRFGNQYYIEDSMTSSTQRKLECDALDNLDMTRIGKEIAERSFNDYIIEKGSRSNEIVLRSRKDLIDEEYSFDNDIDTFEVLGFDLEVNYKENERIAYEAVMIVELNLMHTTNANSKNKNKTKHRHRRHHHHHLTNSNTKKSEIRNNSLIKYRPILEDIEDAEIQSFNESMNCNPQPSYIIEEV
ncbi:hypothetical protein TPHA_0D03330 [Tetrapisispora phaffii CBS 4417]|uniref:Uncharacterized protein n=1 Tax=Tetrapisispora phaffii (strain ATCC 24235 / CBS 4417 / NBRC 1672 / NRRL Y-8282 / UCD 70-5) TaxID=1071381 RepID=G8BSZ8_TETPH|nr:hypothetical protein TPHA_0D03330 [Tetrapisispora phaffii CBS 4417]CCE62969.1 hypothetical protein TPHA_0D03330 [Tetrapisispora phaffii CBS 4417]